MRVTDEALQNRFSMRTKQNWSRRNFNQFDH